MLVVYVTRCLSKAHYRVVQNVALSRITLTNFNRSQYVSLFEPETNSSYSYSKLSHLTLNVYAHYLVNILHGVIVFIIIIIFPSFRAPVRVGLSLPWCPVGTLYTVYIYNIITRFHCSHCCTLCLCTCFYLRCVTNKIGLDWIGSHWPAWDVAW